MTAFPYTRRFFGAALDPAPAFQTVWEVPDDGYVYILRDVRLGNRMPIASRALLDLLSRDTTLQLLLAGGPIEAEGVLGGDIRQELLAGDQIRVYSHEVYVTVVGTGYRLKG